MSSDYLIAGAGITGATLARLIAESLDKRVLICDVRPCVGGNCFDYVDEFTGAIVHSFGPHIFHTNSERIWNWVNRFASFVPYTHRVRAIVPAYYSHVRVAVPLPFNIQSIRTVFPGALAESITYVLTNTFGVNKRVPLSDLTKYGNDSATLRILRDYLWEHVYYPYSVKQWGMYLTKIDQSVLDRVPIITGLSDTYFNDAHEGLPIGGYTKMVTKMLDHPNIEVRLGADYRSIYDDGKHAQLIYTGPVDAYFNYSAGELPYRRARVIKHYATKALSAPAVNYPSPNCSYTRVTDYSQVTATNQPPLQSVPVTSEYPGAYSPKNPAEIPAYPIPSQATAEMYNLYRELVSKTNVIFCGRLADYKYYNMDQAIGRAMAVFDKVISAQLLAVV